MLGVEDRVFAAVESQLTAQLVDRFRPAARDVACKAVDDATHLGNNELCLGEIRVWRQYRRVGGGKEGKRGEHVGGPGKAGLLSDNGTGIGEFAGHEQVGSAVGLDGGEQIVIALAQRGKKKLAQAVFGPALPIV